MSNLKSLSSESDKIHDAEKRRKSKSMKPTENKMITLTRDKSLKSSQDKGV